MKQLFYLFSKKLIESVRFTIGSNLKIVYLLIAIIFLFIHSSQAQPNFTGSKISADEAEQMLRHHNEIRREVGVGGLKWDKGLAAYAQRWADYLVNNYNCKKIKHSSREDRDGNEYGENIFWGSSSRFYGPIDASKAWYSEKEHYTYEKLGSNWHTIGHYTQMVWRNTTSMGAGVAVCPTGGIIIVANYGPQEIIWVSTLIRKNQ